MASVEKLELHWPPTTPTRLAVFWVGTIMPFKLLVQEGYGRGTKYRLPMNAKVASSESNIASSGANIASSGANIASSGANIASSGCRKHFAVKCLIKNCCINDGCKKYTNKHRIHKIHSAHNNRNTNRKQEAVCCWECCSRNWCLNHILAVNTLIFL